MDDEDKDHLTGHGVEYMQFENLDDDEEKFDLIGVGSAKTFGNLVKAFVGTGLLFLPSGFQNGGIAFSVFFLAVIACITLTSMLLLAACWNQNRGSYGDIAASAFGKKGKYVVDTFLVLTQFSYGCVYVLFVAKTFLQVFGIDPSYVWAGILLQIPILAPLCWIRRLQRLSFPNAVGLVFILFSLAYTIYYDIFIIVQNGGPAPDIIPIASQNIALFLGTSILTFDGIGTAIPILKSMKTKKNYRKLLVLAIFTILIALILFGGLGYAAFGSQVASPITGNFDMTSVIAKIVLAFYAVAVLVSYPLVLFAAIEILELLVFRTESNSTLRMWQQNMFRLFVVCMSAVVAIGAGNNFEKFVSLVGGFACAPLGLVFPSIFHLKLVASTRTEKVIDVVLASIGGSLGLFATVYAIYSWASSPA